MLSPVSGKAPTREFKLALHAQGYRLIGCEWDGRQWVVGAQDPADGAGTITVAGARGEVLAVIWQLPSRRYEMEVGWVVRHLERALEDLDEARPSWPRETERQGTARQQIANAAEALRTSLRERGEIERAAERLRK